MVGVVFARGAYFTNALLASDRTKDLDKVVTEELLNLHRGQGLDLLWRDTLDCPTEAEYIDMVNNSMSPALAQPVT